MHLVLNTENRSRMGQMERERREAVDERDDTNQAGNGSRTNIPILSQNRHYYPFFHILIPEAKGNVCKTAMNVAVAAGVALKMVLVGNWLIQNPESTIG